MERELRWQLLRAEARDRKFLKFAGQEIEPEDFPDREERTVAKAARQFFEKYAEPIGSLLRPECMEEAARQNWAEESRRKLRSLIDTLYGAELPLVSVEALVDWAKRLHKDRFYEQAVDEILTQQERGKLTAAVLEDLVDRAHKELRDQSLIGRDYLAEVEQRITRRQLHNEQERYPKFLIDPLDERIRALGRGQVGLFLAPWSSGKGMALVHMAVAYALQGLNVLHFTLEDPEMEVENRLDGCLTAIPMNQLRQQSEEFRERFQRIRKLVHGSIRIVDGTEGGWTVSRLTKTWEEHRRDGFLADAVIVDYDDEIECETKFSGDSIRRQQFGEIYKQLRRMAAKLDVILWTAAQTRRDAEKKKIIAGQDVAEDIGKIRKVFLAIGIGGVAEEAHLKHLYVLRHRLDDSRFGVDVCTDFSMGMFYDRESTLAMRERKKKERAEQAKAKDVMVD